MTRRAPDTSPLVWDEAGQPRSLLFDDIYYSREGGLAEARAVYLAGCGLPDAWAGRERFTVGELGFGTGLNIAALIDLWRRARPPNARLHIFTVEAHPLPAAEARRALGSWPEIADVAAAMADRWPRRASGFHRIALDELGVVIDIAHMVAAVALSAWSGAADAWFLDGFSPALNPGMWSDAVLAGVRRRSAPGARAATFTVAGAVRRGLAAQGFAVEKRPGFSQARAAGERACRARRPRAAARRASPSSAPGSPARRWPGPSPPLASIRWFWRLWPPALGPPGTPRRWSCPGSTLAQARSARCTPRRSPAPLTSTTPFRRRRSPRAPCSLRAAKRTPGASTASPRAGSSSPTLSRGSRPPRPPGALGSLSRAGRSGSATPACSSPRGCSTPGSPRRRRGSAAWRRSPPRTTGGGCWGPRAP